jgi:hypothetical protein
LRLFNLETFLFCLQSSHFDGKMPYWYHKECFFQKQKPKALGDIAKLDIIRPEDQDYIKNQIANGSTPQGKDLGATGSLYLSVCLFLQLATRKKRPKNARAVARSETTGVASTLRPAVLSALGANRKLSRMKSGWPKWILNLKKPCALVESLVGTTLIALCNAELKMSSGTAWTSFLASWASPQTTR